MIKKLFYTTILFSLVVHLCYGQIDPLPSWNEGIAKQAIIDFVNDAIKKDGKNFIPEEERIATFDQDGTLWVEQPLYTQFTFAIDRIVALSANHPEWNNQEPYKTILNRNVEGIKNFQIQDFAKILAVTHSGMTIEDFLTIVNEWLKKSVHPRFQKPYTDLIYQPMLEVVKYLKDNGFKVYIVSGGGQEFIRAYSEKVYGIPQENVIGTAAKVKYEYQKGQPVLIKLPEVLFIDDKAGKPEAINLIIGKQPVAAFGNSDGDQQMLEWSQKGDRKSLQLLVHHDDDIREYAYDTNSKIGTFSQKLMQEAKDKKWVVVSMKNDWRVIFPQKP